MKSENIWHELEEHADKIAGKGILKRMVGSNNKCPMFLGVRQPEKLRVCIIQIPKDIAPLSASVPQSKGFEFYIQITGDELAADDVSLVLSASHGEYNDIFASISDDLYSTIENINSRKEIARSFLNRVRLWQLFFEKQGPEGLSENAQKGLYGELFFLYKYVLNLDRPKEQLLKYWTGPKDRQHDFQFGALSVEVKTTSSKQHQNLQITSEQQLDDTLVECLYLFYLSLSIIDNNDRTLPSIIDKIRNILNDDAPALTTFNNVLLELGYLDMHKSKYEHAGYSVRDNKFFVISDDFPRIRESELRRGVGDVSYSISVSECLGYEVPESEFIDALKVVLL